MRLQPDGRLELHRHGAQDQDHGSADTYLSHLRARCHHAANSLRTDFRSPSSAQEEIVPRAGQHEQHEARPAARPRKRAASADTKHPRVIINRLLATLVHPRHGVTHDVLARLFGVNCSTATRCGPSSRSEIARSAPTCDRTLAELVHHLGQAGRPASARPPRSVSPAGRTDTSSSPARTSRTP
ncbi:transposase family protein [Streptomyces microflavus]|uniref:helix-turn-helix domain-containing protein n=1 Tax=Streptomyces microflavus TaxID=1919 RepID=UPI00331ED564